MSDIEIELGRSFRPTTLARIDRALRWPLGTCLAIAEGKQRPQEVGVEYRMARMEQLVDEMCRLLERWTSEPRSI